MNITLRTGDTAKITLNRLPGIPAAFGEYVQNIIVTPDPEKSPPKSTKKRAK